MVDFEHVRINEVLRPRLKHIPVESIAPPHSVEDYYRYESILWKMKRHGWRGRPLVLIRLTDYQRRKFGLTRKSSIRYFSLTGSHRYAASRASKLTHVPAIILNRKEADVVLSHWNNEDYAVYMPDELSQAVKQFKEISKLLCCG